MNKLLLIVGFTVFTLTSVHSQEVRFGAKLGVNGSYLGGDNKSSNVRILGGFHVGGLWEVSFSKRFALQPEFQYSYEIYEYGFNYSNVNAKLSYIRVPVLAKYYVIKGWSLEGGPELGFLASAKIGKDNVKDRFNLFDASLAVGTSYELNMGLFFSARYNYGLLNINNYASYDFKNQANTIQFSVGYFF